MVVVGGGGGGGGGGGRMQREEWQELRRLRGSGSGERRRVQVEPFLCNRSLFFFLVGRAWASTRQHLEWGNGRGHDQVLACSVSEKGHVVGGDHEDGEVQVLGGGVAALVELEVGPLWADEGGLGRQPGGEGEGEFGGSGVVGGAGELLDDGAEVGWVSLDEGGVGGCRVGAVGGGGGGSHVV